MARAHLGRPRERAALMTILASVEVAGLVGRARAQRSGILTEIVRRGTPILSIGPIRIALVEGLACTTLPAVDNPPGAWRRRGEPSAFDLIGSYDDPGENERWLAELHRTTDYLLLERHAGPTALEDYLVEIGLLEQRRGGEPGPLSQLLRRHERVVASNLDGEIDGDRLAARALAELAAKAGLGATRFETVALSVAAAIDVAWMQQRGIEVEVGDELAFRLTPAETGRWPAIELEGVVVACEAAIGRVIAGCVAPDWLRAVPVDLA